MTIDTPDIRRTAVVLALAILCTVAATILHAADQALLMPRAVQSLLLDISRAGERLVAVGERGHILYSDDDGQSWTQGQVPTRQMLTAVHFQGARLGWAVGHDASVLHTVDGGEHWISQRDGLAEQRRLDQAQVDWLEQQIQALKKQLLDAVSREERQRQQLRLEELELDLEDANWTLRDPVHAPPLLDVFFSDELRGVAVGAFNTLLLTRDGGVRWEYASARLDNPSGFHLNGVTGDASGHWWIAAEGGLLFYSPDYGATWEALDSPYHGSFFGISRDDSSGRLLVHGLRGRVFTSDDHGRNWMVSRGTGERTIAGSYFINQRFVALVGAVGTLIFSDDGGNSFSAAAMPGSHNLSGVVSSGHELVAVGQGGIHRRVIPVTNNE